MPLWERAWQRRAPRSGRCLSLPGNGERQKEQPRVSRTPDFSKGEDVEISGSSPAPRRVGWAVAGARKEMEPISGTGMEPLAQPLRGSGVGRRRRAEAWPAGLLTGAVTRGDRSGRRRVLGAAKRNGCPLAPARRAPRRPRKSRSGARAPNERRRRSQGRGASPEKTRLQGRAESGRAVARLSRRMAGAQGSGHPRLCRRWPGTSAREAGPRAPSERRGAAAEPARLRVSGSRCCGAGGRVIPGLSRSAPVWFGRSAEPAQKFPSGHLSAAL